MNLILSKFDWISLKSLLLLKCNWPQRLSFPSLPIGCWQRSSLLGPCPNRSQSASSSFGCRAIPPPHAPTSRLFDGLSPQRHRRDRERCPVKLMIFGCLDFICMIMSFCGLLICWWRKEWKTVVQLAWWHFGVSAAYQLFLALWNNWRNFRSNGFSLIASIRNNWKCLIWRKQSWCFGLEIKMWVFEGKRNIIMCIKWM